MAHGSRMAGGPAGAPEPGGAPPGPGARPQGLQFELNSKQFGKTMIQAIPSSSISHKFTEKWPTNAKKHSNSNFNSNSLTPGST